MLLLAAFVSLAGGSVLGYYARQTIARGQLNTAESKAEKIISEAEKRANKEEIEAKQKALSLLDGAEKKVKEREDALSEKERRQEHREETLERRMNDAENDQKRLDAKMQEVSEQRKKIDALRAESAARLEQVAGMTREAARDELFSRAEEENKEVLVKRLAKMEKDDADELEKRAGNLMVQVIQRYARSHASEIMTSTVAIPSDDLKGKIIGKEGRNIRTLEKLTGVEVLVDDTPDAVVVSSFEPVRREIAKIALENMVKDGRINPARIEEAVAEANKEINQRIKEAGESAAYEVGVAGLNPKLVHILGSLHYRTSFKQNVLIHSLEVAFIAGALAAELGYDVATAKKAGLLHDIGKAIDHKVEGTHVNIGIKILEKFGIPKPVIYAMRSHHEEYPYATPEAFIVTAADAISASRPGARKDTVENYIKRLEDLEDLVQSFEGVDKSYAIQAGREVRVFVNPSSVDDAGAMKLAREIANRIEQELKYPGEIKVNVMRETRAIEIAR